MILPSRRVSARRMRCVVWVCVALVCVASACDEGGDEVDVDAIAKLPANRDLSKPGRPLEGLNLERARLDPRFWTPVDKASPWKLGEDGAITSIGARNQPLWFRQALPEHFRIEFEAWCEGDDCDLRFELLGDGEHHESGYVMVFGGWNHTVHLMARMDEHAPFDGARVMRTDDIDVKPGQRYKMAFVKTDAAVRWFVDGELLLQYIDPEPLHGVEHRYFGINSWETPVFVRGLIIVDLS